MISSHEILSAVLKAGLSLRAEIVIVSHLYPCPLISSITGIQFCPASILILFIIAEQHTSGDFEAIEHDRNEGSSTRKICGCVGNGVGEGVGRGVGCRVGRGVGRGVGSGVGRGVGLGVGWGLSSGCCCCVGLQSKVLGAKFGDILQTSSRIQLYPFETRAYTPGCFAHPHPLKSIENKLSEHN